MLNLHDPLVQVRVTCVVCSALATLATLYRIYIRRKKFWVDDAIVLFGFLAMIVQLFAVFITPAIGSNKGEIRSYIIAVTFFSMVWSARLSILFSLIRINPFPEHQSKLKCIACVFVIVPMLLTLQFFLTCVPDNGWKTQPVPQCVLDPSNGICQLIADILSDSVLLYVPTRLLMILSDKAQRRRLILIFSTCIITSLVGLAHTIEIFKVGSVKIIDTAVIEDNIALIVCNAPVILASIVHLKETPWDECVIRRELEALATKPEEPTTNNTTANNNTQPSDPPNTSTTITVTAPTDILSLPASSSSSS